MGVREEAPKQCFLTRDSQQACSGLEDAVSAVIGSCHVP